MPRKKAGKIGGWGSEIKGWDTFKGGLILKGGSYPSAHYDMNYLCIYILPFVYAL